MLIMVDLKIVVISLFSGSLLSRVVKLVVIPLFDMVTVLSVMSVTNGM